MSPEAVLNLRREGELLWVASIDPPGARVLSISREMLKELLEGYARSNGMTIIWESNEDY